MLANESRRRRRLRGDLYIGGLKLRARDVLGRGGYIDRIGSDHIFSSETEAVAKILAVIDNPRCRRCRSPLFDVCKKGCNKFTSSCFMLLSNRIYSSFSNSFLNFTERCR